MFEINQNRQRGYDALRNLEIEFQVFDHPPIHNSGEAFHLPQAIEGEGARIFSSATAEE